jgi:pyruvate dehydrogenase E2 component (dihydrolipoamide acetyltransferase)
MAEIILMPRLSDTMTEGVIASWHKKVGDAVEKGDLLAEVETDKATMELESYKSGVLLHIGTTQGGKLQVNDLLAIIGQEGEDIRSYLSGDPAKKTEDTVEMKAVDEPVISPTATPTVNLSEMEEVVLMPRLSDTMTEGVIAGWQKNVGDVVKKGDVLADIETDKATMELESYKEGILLYQGAKAGEKINVNDLLCIIADKDFNIESVLETSKNTTQTQSKAPQESATMPNEITTQELAVVHTGRILASPLAKKLAADKGIDLRYVKGSGDAGRIVKADIDNFTKTPAVMPDMAAITPARQTAYSPSENKVKELAAPLPLSTAGFTDTPVSQMRKTIARRLTESKSSAPHFYLTMSIDMGACVAAREKLNEMSAVKISFNDMVLKAAALSLKHHPVVNSSWMGDFIRTNHEINIGVAVAVEDGLLVPVVRNADQKSLSVIAGEVKSYAQKAKDKKLQPADWEGNTFTISNLGMFGIDSFTAIINPPDACIMAVGGIAQVPVVKDGVIVVGHMMQVTLSCDHRVVDGATGASFLQTFKALLEQPLRMLI